MTDRLRPRNRRLVALLVAVLVVTGLVPAGVAGAGKRLGAPVSPWIVLLSMEAGLSRGEIRRTSRVEGLAIATARAAAAGAAIDRLEAALGFRAGHRFGWAVAGFSARLTEGQVATLRRLPGVRSVERDRTIRVTAQTIPTGIRRSRALPAGPPLTVATNVAVVDTGISRWDAGTGWLHDGELNVAGGMNAVGASSTPCASRTGGPSGYQDGYGHGTHVAGTIGALDNTTGVVGMAPGAPLWSVKVFDDRGVGSNGTVICGLDWIAARNATVSAGDRIRVVNMSLTGPGFGSAGCADPDPGAMEAAICGLSAEALVAVAAGNAADDAAWYVPAAYDASFTVAALSDYDGLPGGLAERTCLTGSGAPDDTFAEFSNYGYAVDLIAPGTCIASTDMSFRGGVVVMSGTSMASPHVAGAAARYWDLNPGAPPSEVRTRLIASAGYDWDAATDVGTIELANLDAARLLDLGALLAGSPGIEIAPVPLTVLARPGATGIPVTIGVARRGGYTGAVTLGRGSLPAGIASATLGGGGTVPAGETGASLLGSLTLAVGAGAEEGTRTLTIDATGNGVSRAETELEIVIDGTGPVVGAPWPRIRLVPAAAKPTALAFVEFSASDAIAGVETIEVERSVNGGSWASLGRLGPTADTGSLRLSPGVPTEVRIAARDRAGNVTRTDPLATRLVVLESDLSPVSRSAGWVRRGVGAASGGARLVAVRAGRTLTVPVEGGSIGISALAGSRQGRFRIFVDGTRVGTVDLASAGGSGNRVVWAGTLTPGAHTLRIATAGGRVEIDSVLVLE